MNASRGRTGSGDERALPAYERVKIALREAIAKGDHSPDTPFVTEREVRERFGVSATTAVRALNDLVAEGIVVRKQGKGTFVAESRPEQSRTPGRPGDRTVSCILQQGVGPHAAQLLDGIETTLSALGYRLYLTYCNDDPDRERAALLDALSLRPSGIVIYPGDSDANLSVYEQARASGIPLVLVDRYHPSVATDAVLADDVAIGYQVTTALIERGHKRIATLWSETGCTSVRERLSGHLQALREHGIPVRPELTVLRRYTGTDALERLLGGAEPPTVLMCGNGYVLARVVEDLVTLGIDAPDRVDLAGMDSSGPFDILPITAVAAILPSRQIGVDAANLLHRRIDEAKPDAEVEHCIIPVTIRTRDGAPGHLRVVARG
ncbi:substrate-binding domain-containing protein [Microlunatus speluncae]|uniref:GntR family transcriptional regulator n=1 Tax=Microlunatus speluncae TaxID=2594267 RepID=UPI0012660DF4|nr:GntR family transcriptional regulator [Microlunatus speluncae]